MKKVKINFNAQSGALEITCDNKSFDVKRINGLSVSEWAFPFHKDETEWKGIYEEMKEFTGEEEFTVQFDGSKPDYETLKFALAKTKAKLINSNNNVVILYSENPYTTKINVNGEIFDTARIQNRSVEEWIKPIALRGMEWKGIFKELEDYIGTDEYNIQFMGDQEHMKPLMEDCPKGVNVTYRMPLEQERRTASRTRGNGGSGTGTERMQGASSNGAGASGGAAANGSNKQTYYTNNAKAAAVLDDIPVDTSRMNWTGLLLIFIGQIIDLFIGFGFILSLIGMFMLSSVNEAFNNAKKSFIKSVITSVAGALVLIILGIPLIMVWFYQSAISMHELRIMAGGIGLIIVFIIMVVVINVLAYKFNIDSYRHLLEGCKGIAVANYDMVLPDKCDKAFGHYRRALFLVTVFSIAFSVSLIGIASQNPAFIIIGGIIWFIHVGAQIYLLVAKILVIIAVWKAYYYRNA